MRGTESDHQHLERPEKKVKASKERDLFEGAWQTNVPKINTLIPTHRSPCTDTAVLYFMMLYYYMMLLHVL